MLEEQPVDDELRNQASDERLLLSFIQRAEITARKLKHYSSLTGSQKVKSFFESQADINRAASRRLSNLLNQIRRR